MNGSTIQLIIQNMVLFHTIFALQTLHKKMVVKPASKRNEIQDLRTGVF